MKNLRAVNVIITHHYSSCAEDGMENQGLIIGNATGKEEQGNEMIPQCAIMLSLSAAFLSFFCFFFCFLSFTLPRSPYSRNDRRWIGINRLGSDLFWRIARIVGGCVIVCPNFRASIFFKKMTAISLLFLTVTLQ